MPRGRNQKVQYKEIPISARLTPAQWEKLEALCKEYGLSQSQVIRKLVDNAAVTTHTVYTIAPINLDHLIKQP